MLDVSKTSQQPSGLDRIGVQILVMAKEPLAGSVKTRLCPPLSYEEAATLAKAALLDTLNAALGARSERVVLVLAGNAGDWLNHEAILIHQRDGDFASRLEAAFLDAWAMSPLPILLIGMDTPQITAEELRSASLRLLSEDVDAVLGLAHDGGYWAIGVKQPTQNIFLGVPMSAHDTGSKQLATLAALGLRISMLETHRDVDFFSDVLEVARLTPDSLFAGIANKLMDNNG